MKKIIAALVMAGLLLASFVPAFGIYQNRIRVDMCCIAGMRPNGTLIIEMRTVDCLIGNGTSCGPQICLPAGD